MAEVDRHADLGEKLGALSALARRRDLDTLVLTVPATLAWLTGARWHVPHTLGASCFDVVVEHAGAEPSLTVVTNAIEAPRLADTELADFPAGFAVAPWTGGREDLLPAGPRVGVEAPPGASADIGRDIGPDTAALRRHLTGLQQARLRALCADAAEVTNAIAHAVAPSTTEQQAAALYTAALLERGMETVCLFVAGGERMARHRHPLPTDRSLGSRAALVCGARRDGLVASVTRHVCFGDPGATARERYRALLGVERAFLDATRPGAALGVVAAAGFAAYADHGFDTDEPERHHQGGLTGWAPREALVHPGSPGALTDGSAVAWNPSAAGWKVEDTLLVRGDGPEVLTRDTAWPTVTVGGRERPDLLLR